MDTINILKITLSLISCLFAVVAGGIEIKKDPKAWLNRFFAGFFILLSFGFLAYTLYHIPSFSISLILTLYVINNVLYNIGFACLFMTSIVIKYSEKSDKVRKWTIIIFILMIGLLLGYIIWPPTVDAAKLAEGIVATKMYTPYLLILHASKIIILFFCLAQFIGFMKQFTGIVKRRMNHFTIGMICSLATILMAIFASFGGGSAGEVIKIIGLLFVIVATYVTLRGFLIKDDKPVAEEKLVDEDKK